MANPQRENGHIDIANEIAEALAKQNLSPYESRILWVIWRKTYGWQKKTDWISLSQYYLMTGMRKSHICRSIRKLLLRNMITRKGNGNNPEYSFQKDYDKWKPLPQKVILPKRVKQITSSGNKSLPKQGHTKEKQQKKLLQYDQSFDRFWSAYPIKVAKKKSHEIWAKKIKPDEKLFETIMSALKEQKNSAQWIKENGQYVPHPTTWLNQERWNDELPEDPMAWKMR